MAKARAEEPAQPTTAELEQAKHDAMADAIGEPAPPPVLREPKPDHRNAIQQERDQQKRVEAALGVKLIGDPK